MLYTSKVINEIKNNIEAKKFKSASDEQKIKMLKSAVVNSMLGIRDTRPNNISLLDATMWLENRMIGDRINSKGLKNDVFSSYIIAILNIVGETQGTFISWNNTICTESYFEYDKNGFIKCFSSPYQDSKDKVVIDLINKLEEKSSCKLLVK